MKSSANIKILKTIGNVCIIIAILALVGSFLLLLGEGESSKAVIVTENCTTAIDGNEILGYVGLVASVLVFFVGIRFKIVYRGHKNDEIDIKGDDIVCIMGENRFKFKITEIDFVQVKKQRFWRELVIQRKSYQCNIILMISEIDAIARYITNRKKELENKAN